MTPADPPGAMDVAALVERVEEALVGGPRRYTRADMAERAGLPFDDIRGLWRALGFAAMDEGERVFTDADLQALEDVTRLRQLADLDEPTMRAMTRIIGQSFARLAAWQGQMVLDIIAAAPELQADPQRMLALVDDIVPVTEGLHSYVWRRQLAAYFARAASLAVAGQWSDDERVSAVGFVDMAGFTTLTRRADKHELQSVLERFESCANDVVALHRGQVVKTIGDEVLFVADTPLDAARIALDLLEQADADGLLPPLRAGVAAGPVVRRLGDVFGATVNIASRLTSLARPGTVLVDRTMADELTGDARFELRSLRPESVRGYHRLHPWRLRRAAGPG